MSDFDRAAFEEWYAASGRDPAWLTKRPDGTYTAPICQAPWDAWQARASRPVVVTDEMVEIGKAAWFAEMEKYIGARGSVAASTSAIPPTYSANNAPNFYIYEGDTLVIGPVGEGAAWDLVYRRAAKAVLSAALNGGT